jgi:four helix bundle protein
MSQSGLEKFGAYQKATQLFDLVVTDMAALRTDGRCYRLVSQQVGSADSIAANIEEGYGRLSRAEYVRFLDFARGSARETRGRYQRMRHWMPPDVVAARIALADEIIGILTASIERLRTDLSAGQSRTHSVRESGVEYDWDSTPLPLDPCPSSPRHSSLDPRPSGDLP